MALTTEKLNILIQLLDAHQNEPWQLFRFDPLGGLAIHARRAGYIAEDADVLTPPAARLKVLTRIAIGANPWGTIEVEGKVPWRIYLTHGGSWVVWGYKHAYANSYTLGVQGHKPDILRDYADDLNAMQFPYREVDNDPRWLDSSLYSNSTAVVQESWRSYKDLIMAQLSKHMATQTQPSDTKSVLASLPFDAKKALVLGSKIRALQTNVVSNRQNQARNTIYSIPASPPRTPVTPRRRAARTQRARLVATGPPPIALDEQTTARLELLFRPQQHPVFVDTIDAAFNQQPVTPTNVLEDLDQLLPE